MPFEPTVAVGKDAGMNDVIEFMQELLVGENPRGNVFAVVSSSGE